MNIKIRVGREEDLNDIMALITRCIQVMRGSGSDQWNESYPNHEVWGSKFSRPDRQFSSI